MQTVIEFHDDNGHKVLVCDDKIVLTLKPDELIIQSSLGRWVITIDLQTKYVELRKQISKGKD